MKITIETSHDIAAIIVHDDWGSEIEILYDIDELDTFIAQLQGARIKMYEYRDAVEAARDTHNIQSWELGL